MPRLMHLPPEQQTAMDRLRETAVLAQANQVAGHLVAALDAMCQSYPVAMSALEIAVAQVIWSVRSSLEKDLERPLEPRDVRELADVVANRICAHLEATLVERARQEDEKRRAVGRDVIRKQRGERKS